MTGHRITRIEAGTLTGQRPRLAGSNARLPAHGQEVQVPLLRLITDEGASGFGRAYLNAEQAAAALGAPLDALITAERGVADRGARPGIPAVGPARAGDGRTRLPAGRRSRRVKPGQRGPCASPATTRRS